MDTDMGTELDGRLRPRQALAIAIALSTRSNPQATDMALELLGDLKAHMHEAPSDSPSRCRPVAGAQDELDGRLVRAFTQTPEPGAPTPRPVRLRRRAARPGSGPGLRPLRSMRVRGAAAIAVRAPDAPVQVAELGRHRLETLGPGRRPFQLQRAATAGQVGRHPGLKRSSPLISTRPLRQAQGQRAGLGGRPGHEPDGSAQGAHGRRMQASASARESK